ncbi:MAG: lytic polysaccharide monooxygenase, partial [Actinomycetota bacterium]
MLDLPVTAPRRLVRRAFALLAMATVALVVLPLIAITPADAHGAPTRPGSRTYLCRIDGTSNSGDIEPNNPACAEAVEIGGKQPLWDWFGVLRGDGAGRTRGYIPDGQLCSGGEPKYRGYDLARTDWPYTSLSAGSEMTFRYNAWAAHPGQFRMYITKDGYDPTVPLTWDDLEPEPFSVYDQGQPNGTDEQNGTPDYQWTATLPQKSGPHIIYSIWERSDSAETFYGCSDVRFDGGTGQVIGIGAGANPVGDPGPATPVTTVPAPTPTTAMPSAMPSADGAIPSGQAATGEGATGQAMVDGASGDADGADPAQTGTGDATSDAIPADDPGSSPDASVAGQSATSGVEVAAQPATDGNDGSGAVPGGVEGVGTAAPAAAVPAGSGSEPTDPSSSSDGGLNGLIVLLVGITGVAVGVAATAAFFAARVTRSLPTTRPANEWAMASWPGPSSTASSTGASAATTGTD